MSLLVLCDILGYFVDTMTANDKYSLPNSANLRQPIQMQLCKKQKVFSQIFVVFLKSTSNFQHGQKKYDNHS